MIFQSFSGFSIMSTCFTPNSCSASTAAQTTAGVDPSVPASPHPLAPSGFTGVGESATVGSPAAYVNAVIDALSPYGITNIDMPVTSDKVWAALRSKGVTE